MTKIKFTDQSPELIIPIGPDNLAWAPEEVLVSVDPKAQELVLNFLRSSQLEQGGLLLGRIWAHPSKSSSLAVVEVMDAVPSLQSISSAYSLQMHSTLWSNAQEALNRFKLGLGIGEQSLRIVGWFHSHPHIGAFFSATDTATQQAFFNQPYSLGWVIDPFSTGSQSHEAFYLGSSCIRIRRMNEARE